MGGCNNGVSLESDVYFGVLLKVEEQRPTTGGALTGAGVRDITCPSERRDGQQHSLARRPFLLFTPVALRQVSVSANRALLIESE